MRPTSASANDGVLLGAGLAGLREVDFTLWTAVTVTFWWHLQCVA